MTVSDVDNVTYRASVTVCTRMFVTGLRRVKHELLHTLRECSDKHIHPKCNDLNENINKMSTTVDFDNVSN